MRRFEGEPLSEIRAWLADALAGAPPGAIAECEVPSPDAGAGRYDGEPYPLGEIPVRHRGIRGWVDLAELSGCRLLTPTPAGAGPHSGSGSGSGSGFGSGFGPGSGSGSGSGPGSGSGFVTLRFQKLDLGASFHGDRELPPSERYGPESRFGRIDKLEEPGFLAGLEAALRRVDLAAGARVLDLGVNTGQELELLRRVYGEARYDGLELVGVDHNAAALALARARHPGARLIEHDLNDLASLELGRFDLLISVETLQSSAIADGHGLLQWVVRELLTERAAVILGFPNGRWVDGELVYGARSRNHNHPEYSVLWKDVDFARRYLLQHRFRVTLTGKATIFATATRIGASAVRRGDGSA